MNSISAQEKRPQTRKRPMPLQIPLQFSHYFDNEEPEQKHSPITENHWSIRILNPSHNKLFEKVKNQILALRNPEINSRNVKPVEFLPNLYLCAYQDLYDKNFNYKKRVSVAEDLSMINFIEEKLDRKPDDKLEINVIDSYGVNIMAHFNKVREFLDSQPEDEIKVIHCVAGINRSATLATAYYIYKTGTPLMEAIEYMVSLRPIILRNGDFLHQLILWAVDNGYVVY